MAKNELNNAIFQDEHKARAWLEARLWADGRVCGYCGTIDASTPISSRPGYYQCNAKGCRKQFTVQVGTVFERSHIKLNKWLMASFLMCASKKGISAHQMHRMLGVTYKSAWFMMHRLREAMTDGSPFPMGGEGKVIEADETYFGGKKKAINKKTGKLVNRQGPGGKAKIVALVERGGSVRSFHVEKMDSATVRTILVENASRKSALMTDESGLYPSIGREFARHGTVMHSADEYVKRDDRTVHSNTIEGVFSIFKRGMRGIYQHCGEKHLHRYLAEFDFRYSNRVALGINDKDRSEKLLDGIVGKRLTYRRTDKRAGDEAIPF
jgi:transposase-like protein